MGITPAVSNLLLGTIAGAINVCFVQPLWVANARLKLQGCCTCVKGDHLAPICLLLSAACAVESVGGRLSLWVVWWSRKHAIAVRWAFLSVIWTYRSYRLLASGGEYKGTADVLLRIIREEGYSKLWAGVSSSLLLCCNPAIQFAVYETVKKMLIARKAKGASKRLSSLEAFVLGAVAKWIATVATYPLQVAQTRLRFGKCEYAGTFDCLRKIYAREGRSGLYRGMETKLWHSTLISALMFLSYEKIQLAVERAIRASAAPNGAPARTGSSVSSMPPASPVLSTTNDKYSQPPRGPRSSSTPTLAPLTSASSYTSLSTLDASAQAPGSPKAKFE